MNCSGLLEPIGDSLPWGMVRDGTTLQVAFGSGEGGFVIFMRVEASALLEQIRREGGAMVCGQKLSDEQAAEMTAILETLLSVNLSARQSS